MKKVNNNTIDKIIFWGIISIITILGMVVLLPFHYWMISRDFNIPSGLLPDGPGEVSLPALSDSWQGLLITLGIMIAALATTISQLG